ncbi:unnamed protein product [Cyprideis torosa]|uniref:C2H2-type domain-containing protein n=1 Tax=Cyprideis torosa TaxID=163714 RepID=A0A7R8W492_9CRUS|nr:unnamed protein product [Cyprideis torosa]CAG0879346.1 unnamed protein product [Cyprideis torosa]
MAKVAAKFCGGGELGKHQCVKCGRYYAHKSSLWRHSTYECMKPKQFVCTFCGKTFKQKLISTLRIVT